MKNQLCVPTAALALPGEKDQSVEPAAGDNVEFSGTGKVIRTANGKTYIEADTINGQPVSGADAEDGEKDDLDDEESEMRAEAERSDKPTVY